MLFSVCDALFRSVVLLGLALAPFAAPLEVRGSATTGEALLRLAIAAVVTAGIVAAIRSASRRMPWAALATLVAWLALVTCAAIFSRDNGPVLKALPLAAPLTWIALAAFAHGVVSRSASLAKTRWAALGAVLVVGAASYAAGHSRVSAPNVRWQAGLLGDPGNESAATGYAAALTAERRNAEAASILRACAKARPTACGCIAGATLAALDAAAHKEAIAWLDGADAACKKVEPVGMRAEALAGLGFADDALREADRALAADPEDKYALFAKARALQLNGNQQLARRFVVMSIARGRGVQPRLLLGLILYQLGDLDAAELEFRAVLEIEPENAPASYDLALVAHRRNRYRDAREGYLRTLKLDPGYADARYNLVLLTHAAGADQEATHHLEEFKKSAPADSRIEGLNRILSAPRAGAGTAP